MKPDNLEDIYELSPMQQGILFDSLYSPESGAYFVQSTFTLYGNLDIRAFEAAWKAVIDRHAVLRTSFHWENLEKPFQVVRQNVAPQWEQEDLRGQADAQRRLRLEQYLLDGRAAGFDLTQAPLVRFALFRLKDDVYEFVLSSHHLILDGWSKALVVKEVFARYDALCNGAADDIPPVRRYRDYIIWVHQQDLSAAESYWRKTLSGFESPVSLAGRVTDALHNPVTNFGEARLQLSKERTLTLTEFARRHQLTINTISLGALALLLSHYSGRKDVMFGATVSGRPPELDDVEKMIGLFINTLAVRVNIPPEVDVVQWLRQVQNEQVTARQYEYTPLVQAKNWSDVPTGQPLFDTLLVFENYPADVYQAGKRSSGLEIRRGPSIERANYPLSVLVAHSDELFVKVVYDSSRFNAATVERLLGHYQMLLTEIVTDPRRAVGRLPLLTAEERERILVDYNHTTKEYRSDLCVHQLFAEQVKRTPDKAAVSFEGMEISYRGLESRANQLGQYLRSKGVGPEEVVGVFMERSSEMMIAVLAILKAGGAYLPLDPEYPEERLEYMIKNAGIRLVVTQSRIRERLEMSGIESVELDKESAAIGGCSEEEPQQRVSPDNAAYVIYTSGSTGKPKGVVLCHSGVVNLAQAEIEALKIDETSRVLQFASSSFDAAVWEWIGALLSGAELVMKSKERLLPELGEVLREVTVATIPPTVLEGLIQEDVRALKTLVVAGEACSQELVNRFAPEVERMVNAYGPTETTVCATMTAGLKSGEHVRIGKPIANTRVFVLDEEMRPAPVAVAGELYVAGAGIARGYLRRADLTAEKFVPNPYGQPGERMYGTGDMVRWVEGGELEYVGRKDRQVKLRGIRVELGEIEEAMREHERVGQAAVSVREREGGEKRLIGYVVWRGGSTGEEVEGLREHLRRRLPEYMVPVRIVEMEEMPLNENGKLDRKKLPEPADVRLDLARSYVAPSTELEHGLALIWQKVLGLAAVGLNDNFFDLGGNSLLLLRMYSMLRPQYGSSISMVDLFQHPNIRALAGYLSRQTDERQWLSESRDRASLRRASIKRRHAADEAQEQQS
jgi:amino acid adenylation domain-containing protein